MMILPLKDIELIFLQSVVMIGRFQIDFRMLLMVTEQEEFWIAFFRARIMARFDKCVVDALCKTANRISVAVV